VRITRLELEGFRAYKEAIAFDCLADAVVLVGPNGYGKTSFFDAVSWALFGHIRRLTGSRDAVGDEYVGNRFAASGDINARLFIEHEGSNALVSRTRDTFAVVVDGNELEHRAASRWVATLFSRSMGSRHMPTISEAERIYERCFLLSQEELTAFVRETSPRERFDIVARLLGVDVVRDFYTHQGSHLDELEERAADIASDLRMDPDRSRRTGGAPSFAGASSPRIQEYLAVERSRSWFCCPEASRPDERYGHP
jgi:exonuclease SbcC